MLTALVNKCENKDFPEALLILLCIDYPETKNGSKPKAMAGLFTFVFYGLRNQASMVFFPKGIAPPRNF